MALEIRIWVLSANLSLAVKQSVERDGAAAEAARCLWESAGLCNDELAWLLECNSNMTTASPPAKFARIRYQLRMPLQSLA